VVQIKFIPAILTKVVIQIVYFLCCLLFKVDSRKITFASYRSVNLEGNLLYIWNELKDEFPDRNYHLFFKKFDSSILGKIFYFFHMIKATYHLATSSFFIIDDFYFPVYLIKPRKGVEVIQLWHAAGIFKKFGLSTVGKRFGPSLEYLQYVKIHSNYSRVYVSSSEVIPYYAEAFGMEEKSIFPLGLPRTDYFYETEKIKGLKERFYEIYPNLKGKKLILYAPTFRGKSHYQESFNCPIDFGYLKEKLGNGYAVLIHLHPYMSGPDMTDYEFLFHIHREFDIQSLLVMADILITDYSSVIFDFSLLGKPMAFFAHDLEDYIEERDFYLDFQTMVPGPIFSSSEMLCEWLKNGQYDIKSVFAFRDRFFDYTDGQASKRIAHHLMKKAK
jgi:CDP-glycerol glycerophosphotransferase (TagB/SpsB family)